MRKTKTRYLSALLVLMVALFAATGLADAGVKRGDTPYFNYTYATKEEGVALMLGSTAHFEGYSQNDLDYRMQKRGVTMEEYQTYAAAQVREFSQEEKAIVDAHMASMERLLLDNGYTLPKLERIVFVKTTQDEESGSLAYTRGTHIFFGDLLMRLLASEDEMSTTYAEGILWHELFHCLTRCDPDFRRDMYSIIHFRVQEEDYELPASISEYFITNPDVEHHDACATFIIDGQAVDCFTALITTKHFSEEGDTFFDHMVTALVPVDGSDVYYTPQDASNFYDIFGRNTDYAIDPEECLADNFSYAMAYGMAGILGEGYADPEIIEAILSYVSQP